MKLIRTPTLLVISATPPKQTTYFFTPQHWNYWNRQGSLSK